VADDRFCGLVACEFAAADFGDEFVGEPVHPVATERKRGLCDRDSLLRRDGFSVVHSWTMSEDGCESMSAIFGFTLLVGRET
jgi:hypothetical protein